MTNARDRRAAPVEQQPASRGRLRHAPTLRVRFLDGADKLLSVLEVEAPAEHAVLSQLHGMLHDLRIQIVEARATRCGGTTTHRLAVVEFDAAPILPARRLRIQDFVFTTLEQLLSRPRLATTT